MDGGWFILSTILFSTVLFGDKHPRLILLSASRASPVDSYGGYATPPFFHTLQFNVTRDYNSMLREITLRCYERLQFNVARDYFSIWIIQSAVTFDRRYDWTADGLFSRRFFFQLFFLAINIPVQSYSPLRVLRRSILTAVMRPFPFFHTLQFNVARDYNSMLLRSRFIITRYHASSLWVITLHHYEISRFDVARDYNSMLREITLRCYSDYIRIWIIQSAVSFYRRYEWTADVYSLDLSFFNCSFWR
jgi:hypothetical protein